MIINGCNKETRTGLVQPLPQEQDPEISNMIINVCYMETRTGLVQFLPQKQDTGRIISLLMDITWKLEQGW